MKCKPSILVSNIFDPYTKNDEDLIAVYQKLAKEKRYQSIETRLIQNDETREVFNKIAKEANWNVLLWLTGNLGRANLNLSSLDSEKIKTSLEETFKIIDLASKQYCHQVGIPSGVIEDVNRKEEQNKQFASSLKKIMEYIDEKHYSMNIVVEPLDEFAHKKNVVGTLASTKLFLKQFQNHPWLLQKKLTVCFDCAHTALNEDNFDETIKELSPYIYRVHFSDAVVDKNDGEYGDHHRPYDEKGIMNVPFAKHVLEVLSSYKQEDDEVFVTCEVRTKEKKEAWENEEKYYNFLCETIEVKQ